MDVIAKPEKWVLHHAGGVVVLAFLMTLLTVCGPGRALGKSLQPQPQRRTKATQRREVVLKTVVFTTVDREGLIFIAPKTGYLIAQRTGEAIPFTIVSSGDKCHLIGSYIYKIKYPDGRETPLRFIDIRSSGTYRLQ